MNVVFFSAVSLELPSVDASLPLRVDFRRMDCRTVGHSWHRASGLVALLLVALVTTGCVSQPATPSLSVTPAASGLDAPVGLKVSGLDAGQMIQVSLSSKDASNVLWSSEASFEASQNGIVDISVAPAKSGSYTGVDPMGLTSSMKPQKSGTSPYLWGSGSTEFHYEVHVKDQGVASKTITKTALASSVTMTPVSLADQGFVGSYASSTTTSPVSPAVLIIGGSEGGNSGSLTGARLAAHGVHALSVAYFGEEGLPPHLSDIPLEYFEKALTWLRNQPGVDPRSV